MRINGRGQAKVLEPEEWQRLRDQGLSNSRDRALFGIEFYAAARISEACTSCIEDVCDYELLLKTRKLVLRSEITFRKENTKGQQELRQVPINSKLEKLLRQYIEDSWKLLDIREITGGWDSRNLNYVQYTSASESAKNCPVCQHELLDDLILYGVHQIKKKKCRKCKHIFQEVIVPDKSIDLKKTIVSLGVRRSLNYGFLFLNNRNPYLFPGIQGKGHLTVETADDTFRAACKRVNIIGASTHSGRRTMLTTLCRSGEPLPNIQKISGHKNLGVLQKYLEVDPKDVKRAISFLPNLL